MEVKTVLCSCGQTHIECLDFTNECVQCGRLYNFRGQALKPMNEWEGYDDEESLTIPQDDWIK